MNKLVCLVLFFINVPIVALSPEARAKGLVYLHEVDPTIMISPRYYTDENFTGAQVNGYNKPVIIMTASTARALKEVQAVVKKDGYCLVVYDAYRPQCAVSHFMRWASDINDQKKKSHYYPRVDKDTIIERGYVNARSGHSWGSRIDLTLIKDGEKLHAVIPQKRVLLDGFAITYLDDGTLDMGSSFDLFDVASHYENNVIPQIYKDRRNYLKNIMEKHGFDNYEEEWWHFSLKSDPFRLKPAEDYFNFPVE